MPFHSNLGCNVATYYFNNAMRDTLESHIFTLNTTQDVMVVAVVNILMCCVKCMAMKYTPSVIIELKILQLSVTAT